MNAEISKFAGKSMFRLLAYIEYTTHLLPDAFWVERRLQDLSLWSRFVKNKLEATGSRATCLSLSTRTLDEKHGLNSLAARFKWSRIRLCLLLVQVIGSKLSITARRVQAGLR